ncbi:MAG: hypothetical protein HC933_04595 [Pleurocapsa sp. SU_196_0]|nr:hypothetical protein [Pleurocapsa sp. SU_196_0]
MHEDLLGLSVQPRVYAVRLEWSKATRAGKSQQYVWRTQFTCSGREHKERAVVSSSVERKSQLPLVIAGVVGGIGVVVAVIALTRGGGGETTEFARLEFVQKCQTSIKAKVARPQTVEFSSTGAVEAAGGRLSVGGKMSYQDSANTVYSGGYRCTATASDEVQLSFEGLGGVLQ